MAQGAPLRLMHVHAHPDDESSKGAASTAMYAARGVDVHVVSCTGGERGSILNPGLDPDAVGDIIEARRREMADAASILGVTQHWLGFEDSGWHDGALHPDLPPGCFADVDLAVAAEPLVALVRKIRPQVMTTYDESGGYAHPDHVQCHNVAVAAFAAAGDPDAFPDAGPAWQPAKLYYQHAFHRAKMQALYDAMLEAGVPWPESGPYLALRYGRDDGHRVTTRVPCADFFDQRDAALRAHATQVDPEGDWFAVPRAIEVVAWPTEDFELAESRVTVSLPEDDLFAGVAPDTMGS